MIQEYTVTIPVIQRAYSEGRKTRQAEDARKSIIAAIIKATHENEPLFFDFVYGNIENNTNFIPFDGQQRLTTLFLFHRYIFERAGEPIELLKKFTYKTRPASSEFIKKLCENKIIPPKNEPLSSHLTNQNWFFDDWKKDPTISSMLIVLDEIHRQISSKDTIDFEKIRNSLTKQQTITFHFVRMEENSLPTATYIKMNARGKTLTAFENFKANLEEYLREKNESLHKTIKENIDTKWLDLFYNKTKPAFPDNLLMAFFNRHFINMWSLLPDNQKEEDLNKKTEEYLVSFPEIDTFISWDIYKAILEQCNINDFFAPLFSFLNVLNDKKDIEEVKDYDEGWTWLNGSTNDKNKETYPSRVKFFAWIVYFGSKCEYEKKSFKNWMRVAFNIIENQTIDSLETYKSALNLIKELAVHSHEIYKHLSDSTNKIESQFASKQIEEERIKAKKILEGKEWEEKIIEAENHAFFKGAIRFLFHNETGGVDWSCFDTKWENAQKYFDGEGIKEDYKVILTKTLVSQCDAHQQIINKYIFNPNASTWKEILCKDTWKESVHKILTEKNLENIKPREITDSDKYSKYLLKILPDLPYKTIVEDMKDSRVHWYGYYQWLAIYPDRAQYNVITLDWPSSSGFYRNKILSSIVKNSESEIRIFEDNCIKNADFFLGWDVRFSYKDNHFIWCRDNRVYRLNDLKEWIPAKMPEERPNRPVDINPGETEIKDKFIALLDELLTSQPGQKD